jgi:hypothetical protein
MALDVVRFQWLQVPPWLQGIGALLLLGSFYVFYLTFRENSYLSPAVRVQTERGRGGEYGSLPVCAPPDVRRIRSLHTRHCALARFPGTVCLVACFSSE